MQNSTSIDKSNFQFNAEKVLKAQGASMRAYKVRTSASEGPDEPPPPLPPLPPDDEPPPAARPANIKSQVEIRASFSGQFFLDRYREGQLVMRH